MTTADDLLETLRRQGFTLRADAGQLLVAPVSRLSPLQRAALVEAKAQLLAILAWEQAEPVEDDVLREWVRRADQPPPPMRLELRPWCQ